MDLLAEIRAAFPSAPFPGDGILSDCWCEECAWSVRNLRGKSWKQLRVEDIGGDGGSLSARAFRYYLPGMLCLAVQHPEDLSLASEINARLVASDLDPPERVESVRETVSRLSPRQRRVVVRFLRWVGHQGWQAPMLIDAALSAVGDRGVELYSQEGLMAWCRAQQAKGSTA